MSGEIMRQLIRMWRSGELSAAEFDRYLTLAWHAGHGWAEGCDRFFGAEADPINVVSD
jgi:hypothetical protein